MGYPHVGNGVGARKEYPQVILKIEGFYGGVSRVEGTCCGHSSEEIDSAAAQPMRVREKNKRGSKNKSNDESGRVFPEAAS